MLELVQQDLFLEVFISYREADLPVAEEPCIFERWTRNEKTEGNGRMRTVSLLLMLGCVVTAAAAFAEEKQQEPFVTGSWDTAVRSGYLAGVGMMVHDGPVAETELRLRFRDSGWYLGVWANVPFDKKIPVATDAEGGKGGGGSVEITDPTLAAIAQLATATKDLVTALQPQKPVAPPFEGEIDYYLGYRLKFGGDWSLDSSLLWFDFNRVGKFNDDQWVAQTSLAYDGWQRTKPWLRVSYYGKTGALSPPSSLFAYAGVDQSFKLFARRDGTGQMLDLGLSTAVSDGKLLGADAGLVYLRAGLSTTFKPSKNTRLTPSLLYQRRMVEGTFAEENTLIGSLSFGWDF